MSKAITIDFLGGQKVIFFTDRKELQREAKKFKLDIEDLDELYGFAEATSNGYLIAVFDDSPVTAAHECLHAAMDLLHHFEINYGHDNQEILARTQEMLLEKCLKFMGGVTRF